MAPTVLNIIVEVMAIGRFRCLGSQLDQRAAWGRRMITAATPLAVRIERILREALSPMTVPEIQRTLRRIQGSLREETLLRVLQDDRIFATVADGRWWLRTRLHELEASHPVKPPARENTDPDALPLIGNVPLARN